MLVHFRLSFPLVFRLKAALAPLLHGQLQTGLQVNHWTQLEGKFVLLPSWLTNILDRVTKLFNNGEIKTAEIVVGIIVAKPVEILHCTTITFRPETCFDRRSNR